MSKWNETKQNCPCPFSSIYQYRIEVGYNRVPIILSVSSTRRFGSYERWGFWIDWSIDRSIPFMHRRRVTYFVSFHYNFSLSNRLYFLLAGKNKSWCKLQISSTQEQPAAHHIYSQKRGELLPMKQRGDVQIAAGSSIFSFCFPHSDGPLLLGARK